MQLRGTAPLHTVASRDGSHPILAGSSHGRPTTTVEEAQCEWERTNTIQQLAAARTHQQTPNLPVPTCRHKCEDNTIDQVKKRYRYLFEKEPAMKRTHHASLQIEEHTQDASLGYRHRQTYPRNFSPRRCIGAPQLRGVYGPEGWNGIHIMCQTDTLDQIAFMHARSQVPSP
jgi:hypothetical protein